MIHKPGTKNELAKWAGSLFFFAVALIVIIISAAIERVQYLTPSQINGIMLLLLLLAALGWFAYRLRGMRG